MQVLTYNIECGLMIIEVRKKDASKIRGGFTDERSSALH